MDAVIKLHAARKARLGPFPEGAFQDHANQKLILGAITPSKLLAGYLLYRVAKSAAKNRASIVHLTVANGCHEQGVARLLVDCLKKRTNHLLGISLRCRRDYKLDGMWQSLGFTMRHSREGRGADGALLDYWWFDHKHDDLFSRFASPDSPSEKLVTAIDANIFYDLTCSDRPHGEDSKVLQADWIQDSIELCVTQEIYNEIHRGSDEESKRQKRIAVQGFRELKGDDDDIRRLEGELTHLFNDAAIARDLADLRQVAHAISCGAPFFVHGVAERFLEEPSVHIRKDGQFVLQLALTLRGVGIQDVEEEIELLREIRAIGARAGADELREGVGRKNPGVFREDAEENADEKAFELMQIEAALPECVMQFAHALVCLLIRRVFGIEPHARLPEHESEVPDVPGKFAEREVMRNNLPPLEEREVALLFRFQIIKNEPRKVRDEHEARNLVPPVLACEVLYVSEGLCFREAEVFSKAFVFDEKAAFPEQIDSAFVPLDVSDVFFERSQRRPAQSEDLEEIVPERLFLRVLRAVAGVLARKRMARLRTSFQER